MDAECAVAYIHSFYGLGEKRGLENGFALMERLGNPHTRLKMVHVAGTNGKGSTCAMVESALRAQGYHTGLYTSPYLQRYHERIRIDGVPVSDDLLVRGTERVKNAVDALHQQGIKPTEFEVGTALALVCFDLSKVDVAVIEVGLGGRLDPTNIITPLVSAIVHIGLDHTGILGDTLEKIAYEKACIAKPGVPMVVYPQQDEIVRVIREHCNRTGSPVSLVRADEIRIRKLHAKGACFDYAMLENLKISLPGAHQVENAATACRILLTLNENGLPVSERAIREGLEKAVWPGRLEWMDDDLLLDGAHNVQGVTALRDFLKNSCGNRPVHLVTGILHDKDYLNMARLMAEFAEKIYVIRPDSRRALEAKDLCSVFENLGAKAESYSGAKEAVEAAKSAADQQKDGLVVVAGSLYLVGEMRTLLTGSDRV